MATKYVTVDTSTLKGLKRAEWYHARGWKVSRCGLYLIYFYKVTK